MDLQKNSQIYFLPTKTPQEKIGQILRVAHQAHLKSEKLLFLTDSESTASYIDVLLWKHPKESFLPHTRAGSPGDEKIVIGILGASLIEFKKIFNLSKSPIDMKNVKSALVIYEFDDQTNEKGTLHTKHMYKIYKEQGFAIASLQG